MFCGLFVRQEAVGQEKININPPFYNGKIVPTPKQVRYLDRFISVYSTDDSKIITAIFVRKGKESNNVCVEDLVDKLQKLGANIHILTNPKDIFKYQTIFSLGKNDVTKKYLVKYNLQIPQKSEGYLIYPVAEGNKDIVLCIGKDERGDYWAIQSLTQLLNREGNEIRFLAAQVSDYPTFRWRGIIGVGKEAKYLHYYKFNCGIVIGPRDWRNPSQRTIQSIQEAIRALKKKHLYPLLAINPTKLLDYKKNPRITISNDQDIESLINAFKISLNAGGGVALLLDDTAFPLELEDKKKFGDGAQAHYYLIDKLYNLRENYPDFVFFFCPPFYATDLLGYYKQHGEDGKKYYKIIKTIPQDIEIFWSGPGITSQGCTKKQIDSWVKLIGRKPAYWDNWYQYGYFIKAKNFPELYSDFYKGIDTYLMAHAYRDNACIGMVTLAEYLWNPEQYVPDEALKNAVEQLGGPEVFPFYLKWTKKLDELKEVKSKMSSTRRLHTPQLADIDDDGDLDLLVGIYKNICCFYRNMGSKKGAITWLPDSSLINDAKLRDIKYDRFPTLADINGDGDLDLLLGFRFGYMCFYPNEGDSRRPVWGQGQPTQIGTAYQGACYIAPCLGDLDNDGDYDLLVAFQAEKRIRGYRNIGNRTNFNWVEDDSLVNGIGKTPISNANLSLADLDNDGDLDLIIGTEGILKGYRNTGDKTNPEWTEDSSLITGVSKVVGSVAAPCLGDLDGDGDCDLLIADYYGSITGYRNTGNRKSPVWEKDLTLVPLDTQTQSPDIEDHLRELEELYAKIESICKNPAITKTVENYTHSQRKWINELIYPNR